MWNLHQNDGKFCAGQFVSRAFVVHQLPLDDASHRRVWRQHGEGCLVTVLLTRHNRALHPAVMATVGLGEGEGNPDAEDDSVHLGNEDRGVFGRLEVDPDGVVTALFAVIDEIINC